MSKIKNFNELHDIIEKSMKIDSEVTNLLLELDVLPSTTTQASLNKMLITLANRIRNTENIVIEVICKDKALNIDEYEHWLMSNFTEYSYRMYKDTLSN